MICLKTIPFYSELLNFLRMVMILNAKFNPFRKITFNETKSTLIFQFLLQILTFSNERRSERVVNPPEDLERLFSNRNRGVIGQPGYDVTVLDDHGQVPGIFQLRNNFFEEVQSRQLVSGVPSCHEMRQFDHSEFFLPLASFSNVLVQVVDGAGQHLEALVQRFAFLKFKMKQKR